MFFGIAFLIIFLDQASKYLVQTHMFLGQSIPIWQGVFHLTFVENPGAAFSIFPYWTTFFIVMTVLVILGIIVFYQRIGRFNPWFKVALALPFGGAVGNLIDRVRFGCVIDFIDFRVWPVFNIADTAIVIGVAVLCLKLLQMPDDQFELLKRCRK